MIRNTPTVLLLLLLSAGIGPAQAPGVSSSNPLLSPAEANQLCGRLGELMEAGGVAIPDLQRAAAPVIENTRQDCIQLRLLPNRGRITYSLLVNLRAYLALADSVPKPFPFSEAAQKQLTELRDDATRLDAHFRALIENRDRQLATPDPANLARYAEANRKLPAPAPWQAPSSILRRFHHRLLALEPILSRQRLSQPWNRGTDQRANIAAHEGRRHRPASRGGAHSDRNQRPGS